MRGHLYCSPRCAREDGRLAFWRPLRECLSRPVRPRLAFAAVALGVAAPMLLALRTVGELDRLSLQASPPPFKRPPAARIETVTEEAAGVRIEGSASPGGAVCLFGSTGFVPDLTRGPQDRPDLVVSFDAGSSDRGARQILDALRARSIHTTVFLTGDFIRRHSDLARRVALDGHEVGNHTDTHPHLTTYAEDGRQATQPGIDRAFLARQLRAAADAWRAVTGRSMSPLWRAPYGEQNGQIRRWAALEGYWHVGWTGGREGLDGLDWVSDRSSRAYRSADRVVGHLVSHAENGGIILLHLGSDREDSVAPHVADLLDALARRGFRFARASEFLTRKGLTEDRLSVLASRGRSTSP